MKEFDEKFPRVNGDWVYHPPFACEIKAFLKSSLERVEKEYRVIMWRQGVIEDKQHQNELLGARIEEHRIDCDHCNTAQEMMKISSCDRLTKLNKQLENLDSKKAG